MQKRSRPALFSQSGAVLPTVAWFCNEDHTFSPASYLCSRPRRREAEKISKCVCEARRTSTASRSALQRTWWTETYSLRGGWSAAKENSEERRSKLKEENCGGERAAYRNASFNKSSGKRRATQAWHRLFQINSEKLVVLFSLLARNWLLGWADSP